MLCSKFVFHSALIEQLLTKQDAVRLISSGRKCNTSYTFYMISQYFYLLQIMDNTWENDLPLWDIEDVCNKRAISLVRNINGKHRERPLITFHSI